MKEAIIPASYSYLLTLAQVQQSMAGTLDAVI
jgi:hypothetical protein